MKSTSWKDLERQVAASVGAKRTPLSGSNSLITASDTTHTTLFIECKYRQRMSVYRWWLKAKEEAAKEKKLPLLTLRENGSSEILAVLPWAFFVEMWRILQHTITETPEKS